MLSLPVTGFLDFKNIRGGITHAAWISRTKLTRPSGGYCHFLKTGKSTSGIQIRGILTRFLPFFLPITGWQMIYEKNAATLLQHSCNTVATSLHG